MYEPVVLRKRQLRVIAGTPASKVYTIINLIKITVIGATVLLTSEYLEKKRKLIHELDEIDFLNRKLTLYEEYLLHEKFWTQPALEHINATVFKHFWDNNQLSETGPGMISLAELHKKNK